MINIVCKRERERERERVIKHTNQGKLTIEYLICGILTGISKLIFIML